jgi:hypothetical protein
MELVDLLSKTPVTFCEKLLQAFDTQTRPRLSTSRTDAALIERS